MSLIKKVCAILFDMDGTLVDSETLTEPTVVSLCEELGIENVDIECTQFFGQSWWEIERGIIACYPQLAGKTDFPARMQSLFDDLVISNKPPLINGSREILIAASQIMPVAIVSSSGRDSISETIRRMNVAEHVGNRDLAIAESKCTYAFVCSPPFLDWCARRASHCRRTCFILRALTGQQP